MKRLINKLKEKPKLYKCLKILGIVGICLSLIFNAVIIGSVIAYSHGNNDNYVTQKEQHKQNAFHNSQYDLYYCGGEIGSDTFIEGLFSEYAIFDPDGLYDESMYFLGIINDNHTYVFRDTSSNQVNVIGYYLHWDELNYDTCATYNNQSRAIIGFKLKVLSKTDNVRLDGNIMREVDIELSILGYHGSTPTYTTLGTQALQFNYYCDSSNYYRFLGVEIKETIDRIILVNNTIQNDIMSKICSGGSALYQLGYDKGYQEGMSSVSTQNDGVFSLFAQAFASVASIFSITILPGFTLGTLIAIPIIVLVIIILFKMFRG